MDDAPSIQPDIPDSLPLPAEPDHRIVSGFWGRLVAFTLDGLILGTGGFVCGLFLFEPLVRLGGWGRLVGFLVAIPYFGVLNSSVGRGQTFGKRVMKIEVVDRTGRHISLGRSLLRSSILGIPYFLNGVLIPPSVLMSVIGHIIGVLLFGVGGAIIYLYVFNRLTRQSLHDLAVGTFVTRKAPQGDVVGSVWRPHLVVAGIWFPVVIGLSFVMAHVSQTGVFPELLAVQRALQASGRVHVATVSVGKSWRSVHGSRRDTTFLMSNAIWKQTPTSEESAANLVASIILDKYPQIKDKDLLIVNVSYGFDIGLANAWRRHTFTHSPSEWQALLSKKDTDL